MNGRVGEISFPSETIDKDAVLSAMQGRWIDFYRSFSPLKKQGQNWRGPCPLHGGDGPNFCIDEETGKWYCHSQCQSGGDALDLYQRMDGLNFPESLAALANWAGIGSASLPLNYDARKSPLQMDQIYDYRTADGNLVYQVVRYKNPKDFRPRRPDGEGGWIWNLNGTQRVLYNLPKVSLNVQAGKSVFVVEGEKDADALNTLGLSATCNAGGAGKWEQGYTEALRGASVHIVPDNDPPGRAHAQKVAAALYGTVKQIKIVELPGLPEKGDVSDFVSNGGNLAELRKLVNEAPFWTPEPCAISPLTAVNHMHEEVTAHMAHTAPWPEQAQWPTLHEEALHGLVGEFVRAILPHTEADPTALLTQFLTAFGNVIGPDAHYQAEADKHSGNLNVVLVGVSSKGRKGTSWGHIRNQFASIEPDWTTGRVVSGLSSGEGLMYAVRDPVEREEINKKTSETETVTMDAGVDDKRLFVIESEFASVLKQIRREGNTLSPVVRNAWDNGNLQSLTKNSPVQATGAHISVVGHITAQELTKELAETESANGFGNRFLWPVVKCSKELPFGGDIDTVNFAPLLCRLHTAVVLARTRGRLLMDESARTVWGGVYHDLSSGKPGLLGAVTGRAEAQTVRLALLYALLDEDIAIRSQHLRAALAVWDYCEASAAYVFGNSTGDKVADDISKALRQRPEGMTRDDLRDLFQRHQSSERIGQALNLLLGCRRARTEKETTKGRSAERWYAM